MSPTEPSKSKFINYIPSSGVCNSSLEHDWIFGRSTDSLRADDGSSITLPKIEQITFSIYKSVLDQLNSVNENQYSLSDIFDEKYIQSCISKKILSSLEKSAKQMVGDDYKSLQVSSPETEHVVLQAKLLPVAVVSSSINGKSRKVTIHDHQFPEVTIE